MNVAVALVEAVAIRRTEGAGSRWGRGALCKEVARGNGSR